MRVRRIRRLVRVLPTPPRPRWGAPALLVGTLALIGVLVVTVVVVIAATREPAGPEPAERRYDYPALNVRPGEAVPFAAGGAPRAADWAARLAARTDMPERTLLAYLGAEERLRARLPGCQLSWAVLAGVGRVESRHGRFGGARIGQDGRLSPPIIGVALDGSPGVRAIRDTDAGRLDGDRTWDRAVGAMQFLPTTWARWGARASDDGQPPDPQQVDDAALTAARYLCASGGDLGTGAGWWKAVLAYNASVAYARNVFSAADAYARTAAALS